MANTSVRFMTLLLVGIVAYAAAQPNVDSINFGSYADDYSAQALDTSADENQPEYNKDTMSERDFFESSESSQTAESLAPDYIINGDPVEISDVPWQVRLRIFKRSEEFPGGKFSLCGGSIIDSSWIVTAAHCAEDATEIRVIMGSALKNSRCSCSAVTMVADQILIHPEFGRKVETANGKTTFLRFDVALLHLPHEIEYNSDIQNIPIENSSWSAQPGEMLTIYGWGRTSGTITNSSSDTLLSANVPAVSMENCFNKYNVELGSEMICAGATDQTTCRGDSGGPLVNDNKNLVGVVSFGKVHCDTFSVFTSLSNADVRSWIAEKLQISEED